MAIITWTGTTSGDWNTTTNWSSGSIPGASDTVIFNTGGQTISGTSIPAVLEIKILDGFTGSFGVKAGNLDVDATTVFIKSPTAPVFISGDFTTVIITDNDGTADSINIGSNSNITSLRYLGGAGTVTLEGSTLTNLEFIGTPRGIVTIPATGPDVTTITMDAGQFTTSANVTTANISGGEITVKGSANLTTANIRGKSVVSFESSGTLTTANVYDKPSVLTLENNVSAGATLTDVNLYDGTLDDRSGSGATTYTNGVSVRGQGIVRADVNRTLVVT
tara:strand:+ start:16863 stop:17693 length:831 start_codon:yes stop_codon:yes gene_type:complete